MSSDFDAAVASLNEHLESSAISPQDLRHLAAYMDELQYTETVAAGVLAFRHVAKKMEAQQETLRLAQLAALKDCVKMGTVEDLPDQVLYDGPPVRFRVSKAWLAAMLDSETPGYSDDGRICTCWIKSLTIERGNLCFSFTTEPEEKT